MLGAAYCVNMGFGRLSKALVACELQRHLERRDQARDASQRSAIHRLNRKAGSCSARSTGQQARELDDATGTGKQ